MTAKKSCRWERMRKFVDLEFSDHVSMLSRNKKNLFFGMSRTLSHTLGGVWNSSILYFVTTSLFAISTDDVEKFIYFFPWCRPERENAKKNLSMSGMSLGFCLKLTTFFYIFKAIRTMSRVFYVYTMFIV